MSDQRKGGIAWTDETWNPIRGCTRVSAGCENCYAEKMAARFCGPGMPYKGTINPQTRRWNGKIRLVPEKLAEPLRWTRPRRIFVNSMSDLFHPEVPDEFIDRVFAVMAFSSQHTFQILTKRPERMAKWFASRKVLNGKLRPEEIHNQMHDMYPIHAAQWGKTLMSCPLPNVWIGVTAENQQTADERIPLLLQTPAAVHWVSMEPLLAQVHVGMYLSRTNMPRLRMMPGFRDPLPGIDWVVVGGESGHNARPMHPDWVRSLRDQCAAAGVPFLFKQWGEWLPDNQNSAMNQPQNGNGAILTGKKFSGRLLDGVLHDEYPDIKP